MGWFKNLLTRFRGEEEEDYEFEDENTADSEEDKNQ